MLFIPAALAEADALLFGFAIAAATTAAVELLLALKPLPSTDSPLTESAAAESLPDFAADTAP
jgi:hypothetical protein